MEGKCFIDKSVFLAEYIFLYALEAFMHLILAKRPRSDFRGLYDEMNFQRRTRGWKLTIVQRGNCAIN